MTRSGVIATASWAALVAVAAVVVARAHYTTDLSAFLPRTPTAAQRLLVDQLREGIASRLILIGIEAAQPDERARISLELGRRLRSDPQFLSVSNGEPVTLDKDRELVFGHRYLLSETVTPERFTTEGLHAAIGATLDLIASPVGLLAKQLLAHDPTAETLQILDQLGTDRQPRTVDGVWTSRDGRRALLVAQTRAPGSDTDGQELAIKTIRRVFESARNGSQARLLLSGPGVFSVAARANIKQQVATLSILSTGLITLLLVLIYRSALALLLGFVPVVSGALAGVAAVQLGFGLVHGITLGFGVTLIGEAVDYSIYFFIQSMRRGSSLWTTILLGVLTSIAGFASLLPSGFPGLAQLGLYSISGLTVAALVTRFVLPHLMPRRLAIRDTSRLGLRLAAGLRRIELPPLLFWTIPLAAAAILYMHRGVIWNRELSGLSPVSGSDQALDALLRSDVGAPDVRYLVVATAPSQEAVLRAAEKVAAELGKLVEAGVIDGFQSPARYLPSLETQRARQASIPDAVQLRARLQAALEGLPVRAERLEPFIEDAEAARAQPLLDLPALAGTSLATGVQALLLHDGQRWSALLPLRVPERFALDVARVHSAVAEAAAGQAVLLDVKAQADLLYSTYLSEVVRLSLAGFVTIVLLLFITLRSAMRVIRVVAPLALAVMSVAAALVLSGRQLTILHIIGMLLIVAVGSNYALFFDRQANEPVASDLARTLASLLVANAATVVGFGVLAFSTVPVLSALGSTVAPGAFAALVFSALLARRLPPASEPLTA